MNIEEVREICLSLPFVTEEQPFISLGAEEVAFKVDGKMFALLWMNGERIIEPAFQ